MSGPVASIGFSVVLGLSSVFPFALRNVEAQTGVPPGFIVTPWVCADPDQAFDGLTFAVAPLTDRWAARDVGAPSSRTTVDPGSETPAPSGATDTLYSCRFALPEDELTTVTATNLDDGAETSVVLETGGLEVLLTDLEAGKYTITVTSGSTEGTSDELIYDPDRDPTVLVQAYRWQTQRDWPIPTTDPEHAAEVNIIPQDCSGSPSDDGAVWLGSRYGTSVARSPGGGDGLTKSASGTTLVARDALAVVAPGMAPWRPLARETTGASAPISICQRADMATFTFDVVPVDEHGSLGERVELTFTPDERWTTGLIDAGTYMLSERATGTSIGPVDLVAGLDVIFIGRL